MLVHHFFRAIAFACTVMFAATTSNAAVLYSQPFATDTPDTATTVSTYPSMSFESGLTYTVTGGVLEAAGSDGDAFDPTTVDHTLSSSPTYALTITGDLGYGGPNGGGNIGLRLGNNFFVYHPGYTGGAGINGVFRVYTIGNNIALDEVLDMGFVPSTSAGANHNATVLIDPAGNLSVTIEDGANTFNYTYPGLLPSAYGTTYGFQKTSAGPGYFDNLVITEAPEPSSITLGLLGMLGLVRFQRRLA